MIVTIRNSESNSSKAVYLTAVISAMTAIAKSKKTLVMQFTDPSEKSVANVLHGKAMKEEDLSAIYRRFEDEGLDALFIRAESTDLVTEHFNECVTPMFEKANLLDVLKPTKQLDYKKTLDITKIEDILKSSQETYDMVYCLLPTKDKEIISAVKKCANENLVCVRQNNVAETLEEDETPVVYDFEEQSRFDMKYLRKKYGRKEMYLLPHNVEFNDAIIIENVLDFMLKNKKDMKEDTNYAFTSSLLLLVTKYVTGIQKEKEEKEELIEKQEYRKVKPVEPLKVIPEDGVQEVTVKKGLFHKKKKIMMINMPEGE